MHRIWLCLVSCHSLGALRNLFSSGHSSVFSILFCFFNTIFLFYWLRSLEVLTLNLSQLCICQALISEFTLSKLYIKTLSRVGPLEACRLSHILVQKKASLTNLCIPPSLLLGRALSAQCPQESTNLSQDSTSHCLVCLWSGVSVVKIVFFIHT